MNLHEPPLTCPACLHAFTGSAPEFCPVCHWEVVVIPAHASPALKAYAERKLAYYRQQYETQQSTAEKIRQLEATNKEWQNELRRYQETYGAAWIPTAGPKEAMVHITWEWPGERTVRFASTGDMKSCFESGIVMLLKSSGTPGSRSDFDFALPIRLPGETHIDSQGYELFIKNPYLPQGEFFVRFFNMDPGVGNFLFSHKEQGNQPLFDWSKTKIKF